MKKSGYGVINCESCTKEEEEEEADGGEDEVESRHRICIELKLWLSMEFNRRF